MRTPRSSIVRDCSALEKVDTGVVSLQGSSHVSWVGSRPAAGSAIATIFFAGYRVPHQSFGHPLLASTAASRARVGADQGLAWRRVNPVMVKPSSSMTLELPPSDRYLAKTREVGQLFHGDQLAQMLGISRPWALAAIPAEWLSRTVRS